LLFHKFLHKGEVDAVFQGGDRRPPSPNQRSCVGGADTFITAFFDVLDSLRPPVVVTAMSPSNSSKYLLAPILTISVVDMGGVSLGPIPSARLLTLTLILVDAIFSRLAFFALLIR
jgi:hypothetical protein